MHIHFTKSHCTRWAFKVSKALLHMHVHIKKNKCKSNMIELFKALCSVCILLFSLQLTPEAKVMSSLFTTKQHTNTHTHLRPSCLMSGCRVLSGRQMSTASHALCTSMLSLTQTHADQWLNEPVATATSIPPIFLRCHDIVPTARGRKTNTNILH